MKAADQARDQYEYGDRVTLVPVTAGTCPLALDRENPGAKTVHASRPGPVISGKLPRQGRQPPCLLRTSSVSPGAGEPQGGCILLPSPGIPAGPGVSPGLLSSPFPGQRGKAGPGRSWLCWVFWVFWVWHCPVPVLPQGSQEVGALSLPVRQDPWADFQYGLLDLPGYDRQKHGWHIVTESAGPASPWMGTSLWRPTLSRILPLPGLAEAVGSGMGPHKL